MRMPVIRFDIENKLGQEVAKAVVGQRELYRVERKKLYYRGTAASQKHVDGHGTVPLISTHIGRFKDAARRVALAWNTKPLVRTQQANIVQTGIKYSNLMTEKSNFDSKFDGELNIFAEQACNVVLRSLHKRPKWLSKIRSRSESENDNQQKHTEKVAPSMLLIEFIAMLANRELTYLEKIAQSESKILNTRKKSKKLKTIEKELWRKRGAFLSECSTAKEESIQDEEYTRQIPRIFQQCMRRNLFEISGKLNIGELFKLLIIYCLIYSRSYACLSNNGNHEHSSFLNIFDAGLLLKLIRVTNRLLIRVQKSKEASLVNINDGDRKSDTWKSQRKPILAEVNTEMFSNVVQMIGVISRNMNEINKYDVRKADMNIIGEGEDKSFLLVQSSECERVDENFKNTIYKELDKELVKCNEMLNKFFRGAFENTGALIPINISMTENVCTNTQPGDVSILNNKSNNICNSYFLDFKPLPHEGLIKSNNKINRQYEQTFKKCFKVLNALKLLEHKYLVSNLPKSVVGSDDILTSIRSSLYCGGKRGLLRRLADMPFPQLAKCARNILNEIYFIEKKPSDVQIVDADALKEKYLETDKKSKSYMLRKYPRRKKENIDQRYTVLDDKLLIFILYFISKKLTNSPAVDKSLTSLNSVNRKINPKTLIPLLHCCTKILRKYNNDRDVENIYIDGLVKFKANLTAFSSTLLEVLPSNFIKTAPLYLFIKYSDSVSVLLSIIQKPEYKSFNGISGGNYSETNYKISPNTEKTESIDTTGNVNLSIKNEVIHSDRTMIKPVAHQLHPPLMKHVYNILKTVKDINDMGRDAIFSEFPKGFIEALSKIVSSFHSNILSLEYMATKEIQTEAKIDNMAFLYQENKNIEENSNTNDDNKNIKQKTTNKIVIRGTSPEFLPTLYELLTLAKDQNEMLRRISPK